MCGLEFQHKRDIGLAKSQVRLYMLSNVDKYVVLNGKSSCNSLNINLWHDKLGHLSNNRLKILKQKYLYIHSDITSICDACHFAK